MTSGLSGLHLLLRTGMSRSLIMSVAVTAFSSYETPRGKTSACQTIFLS